MLALYLIENVEGAVRITLKNGRLKAFTPFIKIANLRSVMGKDHSDKMDTA